MTFFFAYNECYHIVPVASVLQYDSTAFPVTVQMYLQHCLQGFYNYIFKNKLSIPNSSVSRFSWFLTLSIFKLFLRSSLSFSALLHGYQLWVWKFMHRSVPTQNSSLVPKSSLQHLPTLWYLSLMPPYQELYQ